MLTDEEAAVIRRELAENWRGPELPPCLVAVAGPFRECTGPRTAHACWVVTYGRVES
jgi:hypothetical protein